MKRYTKDLGDFITSCAHLSLLEEGVYNRLLDIVYSSENPLPADIASVCRLCRARSADECAAVEVVLREFFVLGPTGWTQARADAEIARSQHRATKCRENGKAGGRPKNRKAPAVVDPGPDMPEMGLASPAASAPYVVSKKPVVKKPVKGGQMVTFAVWCEQTRAKGEKLVSQWEPLKEYARSVQIPNDFIALAWEAFHARFTSDEKARKKKYINWRVTFLNYVKNNYLRLWAWSDRDGCFVLTTAGQQADREHREAA